MAPPSETQRTAMEAQNLIMKNRVLLDDRKLTSTLKMFAKWASADGVDAEESIRTTGIDSEAASLLTEQRLKVSFNSLDFNVTKMSMTRAMNSRDVSNYSALQKSIEQQIETTRADIIRLRSGLEYAQQVHRNRQEYDALARIINENPARSDLENDIAALGEQLKTLDDDKMELARKLDRRSKQFYLLLHCIYEIRRELTAEQTNDEVTAAADESVAAPIPVPMDTS